MIDIRTIFAVTALLLVLAPFGILYTTRGFHNREIFSWAGANLLHGLGLYLLALREVVPDLVSFHIAQACLLLGMLLRIHAIRLFKLPGSRGFKREPLQPYALWFAGYMGTFTISILTSWTDRWRMTAVFLAHIVLTLWLLQSASRRAEVFQSQGFALLQWSGLILLLGYVLRCLSLNVTEDQPHVFASAPLHDIATLMHLAFALLSNIAFHRMVLEGINQDRRSAENALIDSRGAASRYALQIPGVSIEAFGSAISHELNQPLTAITLNLSHLHQQLAASAPDPKRDEVLRDLMSDTQRATALVTNLRVLLANQQSSRSAVSVQAAVHEAVALLQRSPSLERHPISIEVSSPETPLMVMANTDQLVQVLLNLLVNATEAIYSAKGDNPGQIHVAVTQRTDKVEVCVTDNGPGVPAELRDRLFELFSSTKPREGGVGLWLAKTILLSHGASISLDSTYAPGTRFVMVFPMVHQRP